MRCDPARNRIGLLLDGELPMHEHDALTAHVAECPDCMRYRDELRLLRNQLKHAREEAPSALLDRVRASLEVEAAESDAQPFFPHAPQTWATRTLNRITPHLHNYARQGAVLLAACILSIAGTLWWMERTETRAALAHDVLAAHVRALLQDNAVQVASLDTHTVKPWFTGRLEYTPVVKNLSAEGFRLAGARLDYVDGRRVAALVYMRRLHQISLFVWPSVSGESLPSAARIDGYNLVSWSKAGMTFWAISDLDESELGKLPGLM